MNNEEATELDDSTGAAAKKKPRRRVRKWVIVVVAVGVVLAAGFWGGRELKGRFMVRQLLSKDVNTRWRAFSELLALNGTEEPHIVRSYKTGAPIVETQGAKASSRKMGNVYAMLLSNVAEGPGSRPSGYTYVFDNRGKILLRTRDDHPFDEHCLADLTGDGELELIIAFPEVGGRRAGYNPERLQAVQGVDDVALDRGASQTFPAERLQVLTLGEEGWKLLDVKFDPLRLEPDGWRSGISVSLRKVRGVRARVEFTWNRELGRFEAKGEKSPDWEMLYPKAGP